MDYKEIYNQWLENPYFDEATKEELKAIKDDENEIKERFYMDLEFGTAGLRGIIGAGTNRMNIYVVRRATQGLANYIAKVDKKGKVTGVKAGKTTIYATTADGKKLTCKVTVKENKYSVTKPSLSDAGQMGCFVEAYKASYDKSGNLVINAIIINNSANRIVRLKDVKFVVKDVNGKVVGTYKASKYNVSVSSYSTKSVKFTLKKSLLKKKKIDLRNATIVRKGGSYYYR